MISSPLPEARCTFRWFPPRRECGALPESIKSARLPVPSGGAHCLALLRVAGGAGIFRSPGRPHCLPSCRLWSTWPAVGRSRRAAELSPAPFAVAASHSYRVESWRCLVDLAWARRSTSGPTLTQQDPDASWPENAGLPRYAVRSMDHHLR